MPIWLCFSDGMIRLTAPRLWSGTREAADVEVKRRNDAIEGSRWGEDAGYWYVEDRPPAERQQDTSYEVDQ